MSNFVPRNRWLAGLRNWIRAGQGAGPCTRRALWNRTVSGAAPRLPAWLVSVLLHVLVLLLLAVWSFSSKSTAPPVITIQGAAPTTDESLEQLKLETTLLELPPMAAPAVTALPVAAADVSVDVSASALALETANPPSAPDLSRDMSALLDSRLLRETAAGGVAGRAEFFGVRATGRRFLFVVDSSRSMRGNRFAAARQELSLAIRRLNPRQAFYVIFFSQTPERMVLAPDTMPPPRPVPATPQNIQRLERWLAGVELQPGADPRQALEWALEMQPDAVFLLSDGEFSAATESWLEARNYRDDIERGRVPRVVLHTVGLQSRQGEERLQRIASKFGGSYRFVPAPPTPRK